jgi:Na+-transporting methylmalonyl-CoA/oxaloacetate decarboxylase gamma subunit
MNWLAIFNELFDILFLLALIALLWAIWRSSERRLKHTESMERTLVEVATKDAESARQAVETVRILAAIIQNQQAQTK